MTESVEFLIRIKDHGSSPLARFAANVKRDVTKVSKIFAGVENGITKTIRKTDGLKRAFSGLSKGASGIKEYNKSLKSSEGYLNRLINKAHRLSRLPIKTPLTGSQSSPLASSSGIFSFKNMLGLGAGYLGFKTGGKIVKLGAEMEQTRLQFETLLGSVERSKRMVDDINQFANATPFTNGDLFTNAKMLMNFGMEGEKVLPVLKMLGDVSGGNRDRFERLALAFGQTQSAGKLMGQDLLQYINAGFNPLNEISKITGRSMGDLKEEMSAGRISAEMVSEAFKHATSEGGRFYNLMEKQSQSLSGRWSTFVGKLQLRLTNFAEGGLNGVLKRVVNFGIEFIDRFDPIYKALKVAYDATLPLRQSIVQLGQTMLGISSGGSAVNQLVAILTNSLQLLSPAIQQVSAWLGYGFGIIKNNWQLLKYLATGIVGVIAVYKAWRIVQIALNVAMSANPIGLIIVAIGALIGAIVWAWNKFEGFRGTIFGVWEVMKSFANGIGQLFTEPVATIKKVFHNISEFAMKQVQPLFDMIEHVKSGNFGKAAKSAGEFLWNISGVGTVVNIGKEIANSETFKTGFAEGSQDKYKLSFAALGQPVMPDMSKWSVAPSGFLVSAMNPKLPGTNPDVFKFDNGASSNEDLSIGFGNISSSRQSARPLSIQIENLATLQTVNVVNGQSLEEFKSTLTGALIDVVKDVEISYQ